MYTILKLWSSIKLVYFDTLLSSSLNIDNIATLVFPAPVGAQIRKLSSDKNETGKDLDWI